MMKLRPHHIQLHRHDPVPAVQAVLAKVDRLNVNDLLDTLHYPVVWSYDHYLQSWLPGEADHELVNWLKSNPAEADIKKRERQLRRVGLLDPEGRLWWEQLNETTKAAGVVKIPKLIAPEYAQFMSDYYHRSAKHDRWPDMPGISRTSLNDTPLARLLHSQLNNMVSYIIGEPLKPSYSFTAAYDSTSNLPAHRDRPQCVYNISLLFSGEPRLLPLSGWPLYVEVNGVKNEMKLDTGDGCLYSGTRDLHWREKMPGPLMQVTGVFMHWVPAGFTGSLA